MPVQSNKSHEPSMEEVLASIRRIISEEMENPSRSTVAQSDGQHFEFPWSQSSSQPAAPAAQPKLPQSAAMRHPFMPAPKPVSVEPVAAEQPAARASDGQPSLSNADFLSAYFAEIAVKNAVRGVAEPATASVAEAPLAQLQAVAPEAPVVVAPFKPEPVQAAPAADYPFAGIIPLKKLETSTTIQMVAVPAVQEPELKETARQEPVTVAPVREAPVAQVLAQQETVLQAAEPDHPTPVHVADAMMAAFIQANLLPATTEVAPAPVAQPLPVEPPVLAEIEVASEPVLVAQPVAEAVQSTEAIDSDTTEMPLSGLMSDRTATVFAASLSSLTQSVKTGNHNGPYPRLDEFVAELMKPLVSDWMDQHLERIVEEAVRDEIKRVSKLARS